MFTTMGFQTNVHSMAGLPLPNTQSFIPPPSWLQLQTARHLTQPINFSSFQAPIQQIGQKTQRHQSVTKSSEVPNNSPKPKNAQKIMKFSPSHNVNYSETQVSQSASKVVENDDSHVKQQLASMMYLPKGKLINVASFPTQQDRSRAHPQASKSSVLTQQSETTFSD